MKKVAILALSVGVAAAAVLTFLVGGGRLRIGPNDPQVAAAPGVCTATYFHNQCDGSDMPPILSAGSDYAFRGRGMQASASYIGMKAAAHGQTAIVGRRAEGMLVCLTGDADLVRMAAFELNPGTKVTLAGLIDHKTAATVYLKNCTYFRG